MRPRRRLAIIAISLGVCSLGVGFTVFLWRGQEATLPEGDPAAVRKDRRRLERNYWEPLQVITPDGGEWFVPIVRLKDDSRSCWRILDGTRTEAGPFAPQEWKFINHQASAVLPDGMLLVAWSGFDGTVGERIAVSMSGGEGFSTPRVIATGTRVRCLDVAIDAKGKAHVVYASPLEPHESYGPIEGSFPYKCWHASYDGQDWSTPKPIQGRGRFDIDKAVLTLTPSGRLVLSVETYGQFSPSDKYMAYQVLGESGWSSLQRLQSK